MQTRRRKFLYIAGTLLLSASLLWQGKSLLASEDGRDVQQMIGRMTLEEKVGQMLMVGFEGDRVNEEAVSLVQELHAGGVVLFNWSGNIKTPQQTAALNNGLQQLSKIPLLIATDQEGGIVARVSGGNSTVFPGNMPLGAVRDRQLAKDAGEITGEELRALGINMNLAPDLDVNTNPANPVIGIRSFGERPDLVADLGVEAIAGLQKSVVTVAKHFPGHGDTSVDSHLGLPVINKTAEQLDDIDLVPFKQAIASGVDAIMTAHIQVPALDPSPQLPATLSKPILTGLLRDKLGYKGLVMTDSMTMAGVAHAFGGIPKAAVKAIDAGADLVLLSPEMKLDEQRDVFLEIEGAVKSGELSSERIDQSVARILQLKQKHDLLDPKHVLVDVPAVQQTVGTGEHQQKAQEVARRAVTLVKNEGRLLPLNKLDAGKKIAIISQFSMLGKIKPYHARTTELHVKEERPTYQTIRVAVAQAETADLILVGTYKANIYPEQAELVKALQATGKPVIAIAFGTPYDLQAYPSVPAYLATYGARPEQVQAVADILFDRETPSGRLPVTIPGAAAFGTGLSYDMNNGSR